MKTYVRNSAAWKRQKETQKHQREAAKKVVKLGRKGQKYLYPERRDANGRLKEEYR